MCYQMDQNQISWGEIQWSCRCYLWIKTSQNVWNDQWCPKNVIKWTKGNSNWKGKGFPVDAHWY